METDDVSQNFDDKKKLETSNWRPRAEQILYYRVYVYS